jgi:hypothetical protein
LFGGYPTAAAHFPCLLPYSCGWEWCLHCGWVLVSCSEQGWLLHFLHSYHSLVRPLESMRVGDLVGAFCSSKIQVSGLRLVSVLYRVFR